MWKSSKHRQQILYYKELEFQATQAVLVSCKVIFRKILIFWKCYFSKRKIFLSVWLHFRKCCEKYFLVFGCMVENAIFLQFFHTAIQPMATNSSNQKPQPPKHHHHTTTTTKIKITQKTHFLTFSHIFSHAKQIYNYIP